MEHNTIVNRYLSDNERYADLINGCEFGGEQIIVAGDLTDIDSQVNASQEGNSGKKSNNWKMKPRKTKYRDLIRKLAFGVNFMVVGIENQEEVHYLMPLRTMEYDAREYCRQAAIIRKKSRNRKELSTGEFLSGFTKEDKLYPCVTLVLYYGDEWDGCRNLHELLDFTDIPERLKPLVNDYRIHLIEIKKIQDTGVFRTDLKQVFDFIRYSKDKNKLRELIETDTAYRKLDEDAYDMIALYTKSKELLEIKNKNTEGDEVNMCQAIKEMLEDEREEGRAEERKNTERERKNARNAQKAVVNLCREFGATREQIIHQLMDRCMLDRKTAESLLEV